MLWVGLLTLLLLAVAFIVIPLRKNIIMMVVSILLVVLFSSGMYFILGGYGEIAKAKALNQQQALARLALKELKTPQAVIAKLKQTLKKRPGSSKGWYLLGRVYASIGDYQDAFSAFEKAYQLNPKNIDIQLEYVQSKYVVDGEKLTIEMKQILDGILKQNPHQIDTLNFFATDAFQHKAYEKAIKIWQVILSKLPQETREHQAILNAISNARIKQQQIGDKNG
jgi:cytochrome c-type biogenesis protein CcmH